MASTYDIGRFTKFFAEIHRNKSNAGNYYTVSNKSTVCAYCFWVHNPAQTRLLETVRLLFLEKNPPRAIIKCCVFIKFGLFFSNFFGLFHQYFPNFSLFYANFIHFPHLVPLVNFGYTGKNYTVRLFHPVCLLKFWYFSTLCVYSILCAY